jgi:hypothetical protein
VASRPGNRENLDRDSLVVRQGTMPFLTTSRPPRLSMDPQSCVVTVRMRQSLRVRGGTKRFLRAAGRFAARSRA